MAKMLTGKLKEELLSYKQEELSIPVLSRLFGTTAKKDEFGKVTITDPKFDLRSPLHLDAGEYINAEAVDTTVGSFLFNKLMIEGMLEDIVPNHYYNEVVDNKGFGKLTNMISEGLMMGKLPVKPNLIKWLKQYEFYGMKACTIFSPSYTEGLLRQNASVIKEKEKLLKNTEITNVTDMTDIEDELVKRSKKILQKDPGMTLFDSGARGSFENDYKNMNLMLGPVARPGEDGKFDMVHSNYIEGIQKEDLVACGNSVVNAAYPKAVATQDSGYKTKQYYAAYQSIQLDVDGSDCGTKKGLSVSLTSDNIETYYYQNIMKANGGYETLTPDNADKYINKKVVFRSPMFCSNPKRCSVCSGRRFYLMGIENAGLTTGRITNTLLNKSMKNFHNTKMKYDTVDVSSLLI